MFTVYSKPACTYCEQTKALLTSKDLEFKVVNVDVGQPKVDGEMYIPRDKFMAEFPNQRTLPLIMLGDLVFGGFTELKKYFEAQ